MNTIAHPSLAPASKRPAEASESNSPFGLYIHIPFCLKKCPYCDFNTYARLDHLHQPLVDALCKELEHWAHQGAARSLSTVFIGGGTPTALKPAQLAQILDAVQGHFHLKPGCEITCEANPGAVDRAKFAALRAWGVNRLSMGVQSFQPQELAFLGRIHNVEDVYAAYGAARQAGFENINLDFMFGLPRQTPERWEATLQAALALEPEHLSLYSLIVEPNTPLHHWVQTGQSPPPDEDQAGMLYELAMERLAARGYAQYEVSNWSREDDEARGTAPPPFACQHNLIYWRNQEYLGVGPGAHSHMQAPLDLPGLAVPPGTAALRWSNHRSVPGYIQRVNQGGPPVADEDPISPAVWMGETMMMGLRLIIEGVSWARFRAHHGLDMGQVFGPQIRRLTRLGLLLADEEGLRLSRRGLMVGNQVFAAFLPESTS